ncbi:MAG TPA: alpha/beta hydrolase [Limnochordia bacterium]|nr:alpha/beta hydrolase [Limnochordia bacterium]
MATSHLADYRPFGSFFLIAGGVQILLALALFVFPLRRLLAWAVAVNLSAVAVWTLSRTIGLPVGPVHWQPLAMGLTGLIVVGMELIAVMLWVLMLLRPHPRRTPRFVTALLLVPSVALTAGLGLIGAFGQTNDARWPELTAVLPAGRMASVTYCTPGRVALAMDVYEPPAETVRPAPAVLYVHGGGWVMGTRKGGGIGGLLAGHEAALFPELRDALTARGFVVATIDYRPASYYPWPAQIEDAKCAVRFMRAHAAALGIDPDRIGAWGSSAGGNLVSLLATAGPEAGFDVGEYPGQSSRVQAVVDMFGPTDLLDTSDSDTFARVIMRLVLGNSPAKRRSASPVDYVASGDPPFLILHGAKDTTIPPRHSQELAQRLAAVGTPVDLVLVKGAAHELNAPGEEPSAAELVKRVTDFFVRTLGR